MELVLGILDDVFIFVIIVVCIEKYRDYRDDKKRKETDKFWTDQDESRNQER